ncbi:MAG TPA: hypothetical protein VFS91_05195 [Nitrobacter sp.]|nr:hypothetical protein [Nitrobacter sp.]
MTSPIAAKGCERGEPTWVSPNGTPYYRHPAFRLTERQLENRRAAWRRFPYPHRTVAGWLVDATATFDYLTELGRTRTLTDCESLLLERAIFILDGKPLRNGLAREIQRSAATTDAVAADRVFKLINELDAFLVRFNGPNPPADGSGDQVSVCYTNEILRLHANIETLSRQFDALYALG